MPSNNAPKIQQTGRFGQIETIELNTNQFDTASVTLRKAANLIAFRAEAFYSDLLMWVLSSAVVLRTVAHLAALRLIPPIGALLLLAFLYAPPLLLLYYCWMQLNKSHGGAAFYRFVLIVTGIVLAII